MQTTLTFGSITTATAKNGKKYTVARGSTAHFQNGDKEVTVMAFGEQRDSVLRLLRKGKKVTVTAVWDGKNVLKILGPRDEAPAAAEG